MKLSFSKTANCILPQAVFAKAEPYLARADQMLIGRSDSDISRRMAIIAFSIRIASAAIAYLSQVFLARWMGEFEYGIYVSVWVALVILGGLACLGFQTGIIRFISEYKNSGEHKLLRGSIFGALSWPLLGASLMAGIGSIAIYYSGDLFENYYIIPIYLAAICLPMMALQEVQDGIARAYNWAGVALAPTFILRPLLILVVMVFCIVAGFEINAKTAMIASVIAVYIATISQFAALFFRLKKTVPAGPRRYKPAVWLAVTMPIFLIEGFYNLLTNIDILFVSHFMEPEDVAVYFAAAKTLALVHFVYFAVKAASAHRFSTYYSSGDTVRYEAFIRETVHWTFWPSLILALIMLVLGKYFLMLFGEAYTSGVSIIWILTIGIIARASVGPAESVLTMSGKQKICATVYATTLAANLVLNFTLVPVYGLNGAAWATSIALGIEALALYAAAKRSLGLHIFIIPSFTPKQKSESPAE